MTATMSHVLVAVDGSDRDRDVVDVAGRLAAASGLTLAVVLPRTSRVLARMSSHAAREDLTPGDAADAYVQGLAEPLRDQGIPTAAAAVLGDETAAAIAAYAERHHSAVILVAAETRGLRRTVADRLGRLCPTPVVVVPEQYRAAAPNAA